MESALGILEVRGMTALAAAVDSMHKAASVRLAGHHGIGSGWLTVIVEGATADARTALEAGREAAAAHGEVITAALVPGADSAALESMPHLGAALEPGPGLQAIGLLETRGLVPLAVGADAMVKAGAVELHGWAFIGGALVHAAVSGSVGSVEAAVQAGEEASRRAGEFHAALVLPQPEAEVGVLLPSIPPGDTPTAAALGIVEATGYAGSVAAVDGMVKGGRVDLERLTIGSGGRVAAIASGSLDEVGAAVAEGARRAGETAELEGQVVISGPDPQVVCCFARPGESPGARNLAGRALGLVETRTTAGLVKALDEMLKNADVAYEGRYKAGYFLTACVVRGETGAVDTALEVARRTVGPYGELVAAHAIHLPYDEMETRLPHG